MWIALVGVRAEGTMADHKEREEFREMELWEHLAELRTRIIRSLICISVGAVVVWVFRDWVWDFLWAPLGPVLKQHGDRILITNITEMFNLYLLISAIGGIIAAVPFITFEVWGFVAPGLTRSERKGFYFVGPLAVVCFLGGITTAYLTLPKAFIWFAQFLNPARGPQADFIPRAAEYIPFLTKLSLAFGLVFELPVVLMFMAWVGLVTSAALRSGWRYAIVGCAGVAAVATPSADAFTMMMMAAPLMVLYFLSISLVAMVERLRAKRDGETWEMQPQPATGRTLPDRNGAGTASPEPEATVSTTEAYDDEATEAGANH
jgi:sec-independent protein translocase protein TatC